MASETWQHPTEFADQCRELYGLECPPRWGTPRRPELATLGPKVAKVMTTLGYPPMPWQRYVLDVALEVDAAGVFVHREVGLSVPRQQGKTQQLLAVMVHRVMAWKRQQVVYAAQTRGMARTRFEDEFVATLDTSPLRRRYRTRMTNGNEAILWTSTRSKLGITSNTERAGHGPSLDLGLIDEAFAHEDDRVEQAMSPAMLTKAMAQLWWASAGGTDRSVWLNGKRAAGRALIEELWESGVHPASAYFEWYAPSTLRRDDPATWRMCMPALGHTVTEATVRAELVKLKPAEFDRAYLNRTRLREPTADPNVPRDGWSALVDADSQTGADLAFAIDVAGARDIASIAVASVRPDGRMHVEIVDQRPGTDWLVPALVRLSALWSPVAVAVAGGSPAAALIDDLVAAGLRATGQDEPLRGDLVIVRPNDVVEACGQIADAMRQGTLVHLDQAPLTGAVNGARTRPVGDSWAWHRRGSAVDVSPLVAVTLARWALLTLGPQVARPYDPLANIY
ncbi:terminase large subunit domain-containing protein [Embleya sp. NPDC127516]|uniref:terminase large subunit domain-containing protein n=1 Tax=Embleya sp. NPDC127516 TaxID=3363990 RepID=UPI0037FD940B